MNWVFCFCSFLLRSSGLFNTPWGPTRRSSPPPSHNSSATRWNDTSPLDTRFSWRADGHQVRRLEFKLLHHNIIFLIPSLGMLLWCATDLKTLTRALSTFRRKRQVMLGWICLPPAPMVSLGWLLALQHYSIQNDLDAWFKSQATDGSRVPGDRAIHPR